MIDERNVIAMIPARGGSKGIKGKNIYPVGGKPLIAYTVEAAKKSGYVDRIIVSTDSEEIGNTAKAYGAELPFLRPEELAQDHSTTLDAVLHAVRTLGLGRDDILVLLQPTSPLRTAEDIDGALEKFVEGGCCPLASVTKVSEHPILMRSITQDGQMEKVLAVGSTVRRQDMPDYYRVNGAVYINLAGELNGETSFNDNRLPYIMPQSHSVDIDDLKDIEIMKFYLENGIS